MSEHILDTFLNKNHQKNDFPFRGDYKARICTLKSHLETKYYPHITASALWDEITTKGKKIYLNDHGLDHVEKLLFRLTDLLNISSKELTRYEEYILIFSALIHDVGNAWGRENHEKKCSDVIEEVGNGVIEDTGEKQLIGTIASTHGGFIFDDEKDTIYHSLEGVTPIASKKVHDRFLAALLRFADELADDCTRHNRFALKNNLLEGSEVFHSYSSSLRSVDIENNQIKLLFTLYRDDIKNKKQKLGNKTYILDEIYSRTYKMFQELIYCNRYLKPYISIDKIRVTIDIFEDHEFDKTPYTPINKIFYDLEEKGYPNSKNGSIFSVCEHLKEKTGAKVKKEIQNLKRNAKK